MEMSDVQSDENGAPKTKKGSYASRQKRFGPAPLASFEDLPSDDQCSPDDSAEFGEMSPDECAIERALEYDSTALLEHNQSQTITPKCISPNVLTQKRGSDTASQNTLTIRGGDGTDSATPVGTPEAGNSGSFSSLHLRPETRGSAASAGEMIGRGSAGCLLAPPNANGTHSPIPDTKRKGSWTDIFFPSRARSKSHSGITSPRKSPTGDGPVKKKKGFLNIFNFGGRKSPTKVTSPVVSYEPPGIEITDTPRVSVTDTSENEAREELIIGTPLNDPKPSEQDIVEIYEAAQRQMQMAEDGHNQTIEDNQLPNPLPPLNLRKSLKRRESTFDDDVQSLPEVLPSSRSKPRDLTAKVLRKNQETVVVQIESCHRDEPSSESEYCTDDNRLSKSKKSEVSDDDFEAENLLTNDSIDYDDTSGSEYMTKDSNNVPIAPEILKSPTRKERLEVMTFPIERPRSTTPINIVPLEAYIRSSSISPDVTVEKIKLSLPGDQFTANARVKNPRKSNPSIWMDFCEKGLQSPKLRRKRYNNNGHNQEKSIDAFTPTQALSPSPDTPEDDLNGDNNWPGFSDNFVDHNKLLSSNGVSKNDDNFVCTCDCNARLESLNPDNDTFNNASVLEHGDGECSMSAPQTDLNSPMDESNKNSLLSPAEHEFEYTNEEYPLIVSCNCVCHRKHELTLSVFKNSSLYKQESVSSDISSASSRLIGSSSGSKCSPTDDAVELKS